MSRQNRQFGSLILIGIILFTTGCHPTQPFYLNDDGDLSHYLDVATDIEYPDVELASLEEVNSARHPMTVTEPDFDSLWDLALKDAIDITLQNSKVIRTFGQVRQLGQITSGTPERLTSSPETVATVYDPALQETNPGSYSARLQGRPSLLGGPSRFEFGTVVPTGSEGVEAALSEFDAVFSASTSLAKGDQPATSNLFGGVTSDIGRGEFQIAKHTAAGTNFYIRNVTQYIQSSQAFRAQPSDWATNFEVEGRHPLLRGSGTQVNRVPVVLARIRTDITLAEFEGSIRDLVSESEQAYWELYFAYRTLETAKDGRDSALRAWRTTHAKMLAEALGGELDKVAQAQEQYYSFRALVETSLRDLYKSETRLRYIMGLAATDGRLIRPIDEPSIARIDFEWYDIHLEAIARSVELRKQKWRIVQREQEMLFARNALLPSLDVVGLYRWLGVGDDLISSNRSGVSFPGDGSTAFEELTQGQFQEYNVGLEFQMPLGFRKELAGVRHAQLRLARESAVMEEMELEVSHQLTSAVQDLDAHYVLAQTNFNRRAAGEQQVEALQNSYDAGLPVLDLLLDAQRRLAEAENAYYRSLVNYNLSIMMVHLRKGSLLEYNGVMLSEGPWPQKAYYDALNLAHQRDASYYLNYGYTRPGVISQGEFPQHQSVQGTTQETYNNSSDFEEEAFIYETLETVPTTPISTTPVEEATPLRTPIHSARRVEEGPSLGSPQLRSSSNTSSSRRNNPVRQASAEEPAYHWGDLGLSSEEE